MNYVKAYDSFDAAEADITARFRVPHEPRSALLYVTDQDHVVVQYDIYQQTDAIRLAALFASRIWLYTVGCDADYGGQTLVAPDALTRTEGRYLDSRALSHDLIENVLDGNLPEDDEIESELIDTSARLHAAIHGDAPYRLMDHHRGVTYFAQDAVARDRLIGELKQRRVPAFHLSHAQLETTPDGALRWVVRLMVNYDD